MTRVKTGTVSKKRHKKVLKAAKGYFGSKHRLYKSAKEQVMHSLSYAYRDRRQKKRDFRKLWITRINAACRENEISYSKFINGLNKAGVDVNRKMLSEIAINDPKAFTELVKVAKTGLDGKAKVNTTKEVKNEIIKGIKKETKEEVKKEIKKEDKKEDKEATTKKVDYASMTVAELKEIASKKKIEGASKMKKAELVEALSK